MPQKIYVFGHGIDLKTATTIPKKSAVHFYVTAGKMYDARFTLGLLEGKSIADMKKENVKLTNQDDHSDFDAVVHGSACNDHYCVYSIDTFQSDGKFIAREFFGGAFGGYRSVLEYNGTTKKKYLQMQKGDGPILFWPNNGTGFKLSEIISLFKGLHTDIEIHWLACRSWNSIEELNDAYEVNSF